MSVAEVFLRGGRPCTTPTEFTTAYATRYAHWRWVVFAPRQWCHDATTNRVSCPAFHLLFGLAAAEPERPGTTRQDWHLLYVDLHKDITRAVRGAEAASLVGTVLQGIAKGLQPRTLHLIGAVDGGTHDRLGLFSQRDWQAVCSRLRERCAKTHPDLRVTQSFLQDGTASAADEAGSGPRGGEDGGDDARPASAGTMTEAWVGVLRQAVTWLRAQSGLVGAQDASIAPQTHNEPLLALLSQLNPLLWSSFYVRPDKARGEGSGNSSGGGGDGEEDIELLTGTAKLRAMRDAARKTWRRQTGEYAAFALPTACGDVKRTESDGASEAQGTGATPAFPFVFFLQRPLRARRPVDLDNRDPGPLSPQPIAAELHLLPDRGDVLYLVRQMSNTATIQFVYDDYLHEEGELFVQLGPVEGVGFDDLDRMLAAAPSELPPPVRCDRAREADGRPCVVCPGSCSPCVFPRVLRRVPTGATHKPNPLAHAQAAVKESGATAAMMQNAALALRYLSDHLVPLAGHKSSTCMNGGDGGGNGGWAGEPGPGYTLPWDDAAAGGVAAFADPQRRCMWCDRQREKLLRCGGCRAVLYCCKAHQALDWKEGNHKADCRAWRSARELAETQVEPFLSRLPPAAAATRTLGWSYAACIAQFLLATAARLPPVRPRCVHVLGVHGAHLAPLLDALAAHADTLDAKLRDSDNKEKSGETDISCSPLRLLFSSDTFTEAQRNEVWAVGREGRVRRLPSKGVIGDAWHLAALAELPCTKGEAAPLLLVRISNTKYYLYDQGSQQDGSRPHALLSFGPPHSTAGLSYFDASVELVVRDLLGRVPTRWVESSYMAAVRTYKTLVTRVMQCESCPAALRSAMATPAAAGGAASQTAMPIVFNTDGVAAEGAEREEEEDKEGEPSGDRRREGNGLYVYTNGFYIDVDVV